MNAGELVHDNDHDAMWRVRMPDGNLSDLLNRQRATELTRLLRLEARNKGKQRGTAA